MTRDYARRSSTTASRKKTTGRKTSNRSRPKARPDKARRSQPRASKGPSTHSTIWSAPSFSAGVVFGAALVLLASYAPDAFEDTVVAVREQVMDPAEEIQFVFPDMLENDSVEPDPDAYDGEFADDDPDAVPVQFMIQAASLKSFNAASNLAAELNNTGLNARFERVDLDQVIWYRIMVGPFPGRLEANRAMTSLRRRNLGPTLIKPG